MALSEQTFYRMTILEDGIINVQKVRQVLDDGKLLTETYHRHVLAPGEDYSKEDPRVQKAAQTFHTEEVVTAFREKMDAIRASAEAPLIK
jgi:hypothetical protein